MEKLKPILLSQVMEFVLTSKEQHWRSPTKKLEEEKTIDYEADRKNPEVWKN